MIFDILCSEWIYNVKLFISITEKIDWGSGMEIIEVVIIVLNGQAFAAWLILTLLFHQTMKCSSDSSQTIVKFQRALRLGLKKVGFFKMIWNFSIMLKSSCFIKILIYSLFCFKFLTVEELLHPMEPFCLLNIHKTIQTTRIVSGSSDSLKKNELCWNSWHSIWSMLIVAGKWYITYTLQSFKVNIKPYCTVFKYLS